MANSKVFTGADGELLFVPSQSGVTGGDAVTAQEIIESFELEKVGRVKNIELFAHQDIRAFYSLGTNLPTELRTGNIKIWGKVRHAYVNGALLKLLLGKYAAGENPESPFAAPTFSINMHLKTPDVTEIDYLSRLEITNVVFDNWQFVIPEDDFVLEEASFQAKQIIVHDQEPQA